MAHFYGEIQGNRGSTSRIGTKNSGIEASIRGWNIGVRVQLFHSNGRDTIRIYKTTGSHGNDKAEPNSCAIEFSEKKQKE